MIYIPTFLPERGMNAAAYRWQISPMKKLLADIRVTDKWNIASLPPIPHAISAREVIAPDVSFWQDDDLTQRKIDFAQMKAAGAQGVIIRGGQGNYIDEDFVDYWRAAKAAGLPRGAYWYYDPRVAPNAQADLFASLFAVDPPELSLTLDAEYPTSWGGAYAGWQNLYDFMERLKLKQPKPQKEIYTGYYWWYDNVWTKTTSAQLAYFKQYPLHLAWYINDVSYVKIPLPWTQAEFRWWQYTDKGNGTLYGVESLNIDLNYFVQGGTDVYRKTFSLGATTTPPPPVESSTPLSGVEYHKGTVNGVAYFVLLIDMNGKRAHVTNLHGSLERVSDAAKRLGAQIVVNGDGWDFRQPAPWYPISLAASDGDVYQPHQFEYRPFLNFSRDNAISIRHIDLDQLFNTVSFTRYLVRNGVKETYLNDPNKIENIEMHARSAKGHHKDGRFMIIGTEGKVDPNTGAPLTGSTLPQLADLFVQYGAKDAGESDGGGSFALWLIDRIVNQFSDPEERWVVNHLAIFIGEPTMPTDVDIYEYTATGNRAIRTGPGATYPRIASNSDFLINTKALGGATPADRVTLDGATAVAVQGLAGDVWVKVYDNAGKAVVGWTAKIHKGQPQLTERFIPAVTPPTTKPSIFITHTFTDELIVTNPDGTLQAYNANFTVPDVEYKPKP